MLIASIIITLMFSAYFSGMEIAFVSSNRMLVEMEKDNNSLVARILDKFYRQPNAFVSTMLVGNNIALVVYGILIAKLLDSTIFANIEASISVPADTIISTIIVLFTGEFIPKIVFKNASNRLLVFFAIPTFLFYVILWPISKFATFLSRILLRPFGIKIKRVEDDEEFSKVDLGYLVQSSIDNARDEDEIDEEVKIFQNALDFSETKVRDCIIPRTEIFGVDKNDCTTDELKQLFIESGHSKLIVYEDDVDHIVGYIHSSEMFHNPDTWKEHIQTIPFVPETMAAQKVMQTFLQKKKSLAVVVDEFGGTSGIVSLEDIVEEIFGEIEDEHDTSNLISQRVADDEYLLSARLEIDQVNDMFDLDLPESDEYMTIGGLILNHYQSFPKLNEVIEVGKYSFKILKKTNTKIELVRLKIN